MPKDYKIEVVTKEGYTPIKIQIKHEDNEHWINTFADLSEGYYLDEMGKWCEENECGHRTAYNEFKFRNKDQLSYFILRWS